MTARVALIGANGYGIHHRRVIAPAHAAGELRLVGLCDLAPIRDEPDAPVPPDVPVFTDYRGLLDSTAPDLVVIATPPHTHLEIATRAAEAGADLLLEKPPLTSLAEHAALTEVLAATGRLCQVGFQALGSAALAELTTGIRGGTLGQVTGISAVGAWQRPDSYYTRAPWAGRRQLAGRPVLDGALANPFAHAVMQCLAVAEAAAGAPVWPVEVELERYRARPIEVDDTAVLRIRLREGPPIVVAVTLCADERVGGDVLVHTGRGLATLGYTTDRLQLPGEPAPRPVPGRTGLLADLLAHRTAGRGRLLAPLARTAGFTAVIEALLRAPVPREIGARHRVAAGAEGQRVITVPGVSRVLQHCAAELTLPSESGVGWAGEPWHTDLPATLEGPTGTQ